MTKNAATVDLGLHQGACVAEVELGDHSSVVLAWCPIYSYQQGVLLTFFFTVCTCRLGNFDLAQNLETIIGLAMASDPHSQLDNIVATWIADEAIAAPDCGVLKAVQAATKGTRLYEPALFDDLLSKCTPAKPGNDDVPR